MNVAFGYQIDRRGRTASASDSDHLNDMIEQVLFTSPGERVNRPDFGSGLLQMTFEPNSPQLASGLQFTVQGALQHWLGDLISVQSVQITQDDSQLQVTVVYTVRASQDQRIAQFAQGL